MLRLLATGLSMILANAAFAQADINCAKPELLTQRGMNHCAEVFYQMADEDLNLAYRLARETLAENEKNIAQGRPSLPDDYTSGVILLRDAQRAWIQYRDAACSVEGHLHFGGSIRPLIVSSCKETLTRARTESLRSAFEAN